LPSYHIPLSSIRRPRWTVYKTGISERGMDPWNGFLETSNQYGFLETILCRFRVIHNYRHIP
jgi:hypothetical protein